MTFYVIWCKACSLFTQDILQGESLKLDESFNYSFINELMMVRTLYVSSSPRHLLQVHGFDVGCFWSQQETLDRAVLTALFWTQCMHKLSFFWPSVLWRCWLGSRKGIRPVKNWVVGCWCGYLSGARCRLAYGPADATATHCLLLQ